MWWIFYYSTLFAEIGNVLSVHLWTCDFGGFYCINIPDDLAVSFPYVFKYVLVKFVNRCFAPLLHCTWHKDNLKWAHLKLKAIVWTWTSRHRVRPRQYQIGISTRSLKRAQRFLLAVFSFLLTGWHENIAVNLTHAHTLHQRVTSPGDLVFSRMSLARRVSIHIWDKKIWNGTYCIQPMFPMRRRSL